MSITALRAIPGLVRSLCRLAPLFMLVLAGCLPGTEHSVVDRPLANDTRMPGAWVASLGDEDMVVLRVKAETPERLSADIGVLADTFGIAHYRVVRTRIGDRDILELTETEDSNRAGAGAALDLPRRFFVGYAFDEDGHLIVSLQNELETPLEAVAKTGTLPFRPEQRGGNSRIVITAPTHALRAAIAAMPEVFGTPPLVFAKLPALQK